MAPERLYSPEEVAEYLKITKQTVLAHIRSRRLRARKVGRFWRVSESDLQDYLDTYINQPGMSPSSTAELLLEPLEDAMEA